MKTPESLLADIRDFSARLEDSRTFSAKLRLLSQKGTNLTHQDWLFPRTGPPVWVGIRVGVTIPGEGSPAFWESSTT